MGAALTETELAALGQARLAAASQGSASHMFWQLHPFDARAVIPCAANASASPGWSIDLLGEDAAPSAWMLKADRGAALECACHCGWNESCPGVVSVCAGAHHEPPAPPARAEHRNHKVATDSHTQSEIAARTAGTGRHYAGEADRGELHMHHEQYESSPALPAQQSTAPRRGFFAALFGGAAALATREAPSVPAESSWPEPASGSQYRGALHEPESGALSWPAVEFPPTFDAPAIEHYAASWGAPKLPAPDAPIIDWDASSAAWGDPGESYDYAALPAPEVTETSNDGGSDER